MPPQVESRKFLRWATVVVLLVLALFAADRDARVRANNDTSDLSRKFCEQQYTFSKLPTRIPVTPKTSPTGRQLVTFVEDLQRSGAKLYVTFDCAEKR